MARAHDQYESWTPSHGVQTRARDLDECECYDETTSRGRFAGFSALFVVPANVVITYMVATTIGLNGIGLMVLATSTLMSVLLVLAEIVSTTGYDPFR